MNVKIKTPVFGLLNGETVQVLAVNEKLDTFKLLKIISHNEVTATADEFNHFETTTDIKNVVKPVSPNMDKAFQILVDSVDNALVTV